MVLINAALSACFVDGCLQECLLQVVAQTGFAVDEESSTSKE